MRTLLPPSRPLTLAVSLAGAMLAAPLAAGDTVYLRHYSSDLEAVTGGIDIAWNPEWEVGDIADGSFGTGTGGGGGTGNDNEGSDPEAPPFIDNVTFTSDGTITSGSARYGDGVAVIYDGSVIASTTVAPDNTFQVSFTGEPVSSGQRLTYHSNGVVKNIIVPPGINELAPPSSIQVPRGGEYAIGAAPANKGVIARLDSTGETVGSATANGSGQFNMTLSPTMTGGELLAFVSVRDSGDESSETFYIVPEGTDIVDLDGSTDPINDFNLVFADDGLSVTGDFWPTTAITVTDKASGEAIGSTMTDSEGAATINLSPRVVTDQVLIISNPSRGSVEVTVPMISDPVLTDCYDPANAGTVGIAGECDGLYIVADRTELKAIMDGGGIAADTLFTGQVTSFNKLFKDKPGVDPGISTWQTKNVASLRETFSGAGDLTGIDLSAWDTKNVTTMDSTFRSTTMADNGLASWDISGVRTMGALFRDATLNQLDISTWDTSNVRGFNSMFYGTAIGDAANIDNISLAGAGTASPTGSDYNLYQLFRLSTFNTLDLSTWDFGTQGHYASYIFKGAKGNSIIMDGLNIDFSGSNLHAFEGLDVNTLSMRNANIPSSLIFDGSRNTITRIDNLVLDGATVSGRISASHSYTDIAHTSARGAMLGDRFEARNSVDLTGATLDGATLMLNGASSVAMDNLTLSGDVTFRVPATAAAQAPINTWTSLNLTGLNYLYYDVNDPTLTVDFAGLDMSGVTSMKNLFQGATIKTIDASGWGNGGVVTDISGMFDGLTVETLNLTGWSPINVQSLNNVFANTAIQNLDLSSWNTTNVTSAQGLFANAEFDTLNLSNWDLSSATTLKEMFLNAQIRDLNLTGWDSWSMEGVSDLSYMFAGLLTDTALNLDNWQFTGFQSVDNKDMEHMFSGTTAPSLSVKNWDHYDTGDMSYMFYNTNIPTIDVTGWTFDGWPEKTKSFTDMFYGSSVNQITGIENWNTASVTSMYYMFSGAGDFNQDLSGWDVSSVTSMGYMFRNATNFNQDLSGWDVSSVKGMHYMFSGAASFNQDIGGWDVSGVSNMNYMFSGAAIFNQDLSCWDVSYFASEPSRFSLNATAWTLPKPEWGVDQATKTGCPQP
nr:BspA family leucine-rich repeat surface protein [uncultured Halomonas sp.]